MCGVGRSAIAREGDSPEAMAVVQVQRRDVSTNLPWGSTWPKVDLLSVEPLPKPQSCHEQLSNQEAVDRHYLTPLLWGRP
jgi:hypothetical protein